MASGDTVEDEKDMKHYKSLGRSGLAFVLVTLVTLLLASGAGAQSKYKTLHRFTGGGKDQQPLTGLIFDPARSLYGTTSGGVDGTGTVFKLTPNSDGSWTENVLYGFCSLMFCLDGDAPHAGLIFDVDGNLYGTTYAGGAAGLGAIFELTPNSDGTWTESVLYSFCSLSNCVDGRSPYAGLIFDQVGNLYGTTWLGGAGGQGTVFKLTPHSDRSWTESVVHSFEGVDGAYPAASLIFDLAGTLYGTTYIGGASKMGVVFRLTPKANGAWTESVVHSFMGSDGAQPNAGLVFDQAGSLYGTTTSGGNCNVDSSGCGTVFKLTPSANGRWKAKVIHQFKVSADGAFPWTGLSFDQSGNLYGTTAGGGDPTHCSSSLFGCGVVFKLAPNSKGGWSERVVHRFVDRQEPSPSARWFSTPQGISMGRLTGTTTQPSGRCSRSRRSLLS
jgi:uncharacterized repeat protein (TIGR03803 family)